MLLGPMQVLCVVSDCPFRIAPIVALTTLVALILLQSLRSSLVAPAAQALDRHCDCITAGPISFGGCTISFSFSSASGVMTSALPEALTT